MQAVDNGSKMTPESERQMASEEGRYFRFLAEQEAGYAVPTREYIRELGELEQRIADLELRVVETP